MRPTPHSFTAVQQRSYRVRNAMGVRSERFILETPDVPVWRPDRSWISAREINEQVRSCRRGSQRRRRPRARHFAAVLDRVQVLRFAPPLRALSATWTRPARGGYLRLSRPSAGTTPTSVPGSIGADRGADVQKPVSPRLIAAAKGCSSATGGSTLVVRADVQLIRVFANEGAALACRRRTVPPSDVRCSSDQAGRSDPLRGVVSHPEQRRVAPARIKEVFRGVCRGRREWPPQTARQDLQSGPDAVPRREA
jgi:hypothetical protein